jgi:superfamily II DNA/RNA helicase
MIASPPCPTPPPHPHHRTVPPYLSREVGVEDYVHRIGRTGRAGSAGRAHTFFPPKPDDRHHGNSHDFVRHLQAAGHPVPPALLALDRGPCVSARNQRKGAVDKAKAYEAKRAAHQASREP